MFMKLHACHYCKFLGHVIVENAYLNCHWKKINFSTHLCFSFIYTLLKKDFAQPQLSSHALVFNSGTILERHKSVNRLWPSISLSPLHFLLKTWTARWVSSMCTLQYSQWFCFVQVSLTTLRLWELQFTLSSRNRIRETFLVSQLNSFWELTGIHRPRLSKTWSCNPVLR